MQKEVVTLSGRKKFKRVFGKWAPSTLNSANVFLPSVLGALWKTLYSTLLAVCVCSIGCHTYGLGSPHVSISSCFKGTCRRASCQSVLCWWLLQQKLRPNVSGDGMWFCLLHKIIATAAWEGEKDLSMDGICTACWRKIHPWSMLYVRRVASIWGMQDLLSTYSCLYSLLLKQLLYYTVCYWVLLTEI